jgi:hypothetical protein
MQYTTLFIAALAAVASALPAAEPATASAAASATATSAAAATKTKLIDLWEDPNFLGLKFTGQSTVGTCENLKNKNVISSAKSKPGFRCTVWVQPDCNGTGFSFNAKPGSAQFPEWIDNKSKSWKCVVDETAA